MVLADNCDSAVTGNYAAYYAPVNCKSGTTNVSIAKLSPTQDKLRTDSLNVLRCSGINDTVCAVPFSEPLSIGRLYFKNTSPGAVNSYYWVDWNGINQPFNSAGIVPADTLAPTITTIERQAPATSPTDADTVSWRITFSEAVSNVDVTDFAVAGTSATPSLSSSNTSVYTISLSGGDLTNLNDTVTLSISGSQNIQDSSGNPLTNTAATGTNNNSFIIENDTSAPTITSIERRTPATSPTDADSVSWRITFSEAVNNVDITDFAVTGTSATSSLSSTNTSIYTISLSGGDLANLNDTITLSITGSQNIQDSSGNALTNTAATGTNNNSFIIANDTSSPTVQINNAPNSLSTMEPFEITVQFSEPVSGFNLSDLNVGNGYADNFIAVDDDTYTTDIHPDGKGDTTLSINANIALDAAGNPNSAATTIIINCGHGCNSEQTIATTQRAIRNFSLKRILNISSQDIGLAGLLNNEIARGGLNGFGEGPVNLNLTSQDHFQQASISTSLRQFTRTAVPQSPHNYDPFNTDTLGKTKPVASAKTNLWLKGNWTESKSSHPEMKETSRFSILYIGADYRYSNDVLLGFIGQLDWMDQESDSLAIDAEGQGWMLGPYMVSRLNEDLIFDLRLAWGRSDNRIKTQTTTWDDYRTERWQVESHLTGNYDYQNWHLTPSLGINYFQEKQHSYIDSNNFTIGTQTINSGSLNFGPLLSYSWHSSDGTTIKPMLGIKGIWHFDEPAFEDLSGIAAQTNELSAQIKLGTQIILSNGFTFQGGYSYDGIGVDNYKAQAIEVIFNMNLNSDYLPPGATLQGSYSLTGDDTLNRFDAAIRTLSLTIPF
ncbi:Ig-like domain-containing protein [Amphritea balenae]|nr:Ig-like domain-containing protein [Amphritea balenae]GGK59728.1 hypothetical protein GCM10007941_07490 [Amphritea balenae]